MVHSTLTELSAGLQSGNVSSVEVTRHCLERIERLNPGLNCFITVEGERALSQAAQADRRLARGDGGPLTGIPIAHKDLFCIRGMRTTCGSKMLENFVAPYDSTVTERLDAAGAVAIGKTNMDEFAMGSSNENSYFGPVRNPWDRTAVPGGSSGGSAAAVAARLCAAATGTDTGGSVRQPASHCGVTGIKPTYGRVSRWGIVAFASSLDQAGILAQSAEDAALLLTTIAGFDPKDSTSIDAAVPDYVRALERPIGGLRIGLPKEYFGEGLAPEVRDIVESAIRVIQDQGAKTVAIDLPNSALALPAYYVVAPAEASSNLARYDGVRFGYRCEAPRDLTDMYLRSRGEGFGPEVKRRIMVGTYALSAGYYDAYYLKAQKVRRLIRDDFGRAFEQVDVIASPAAPTPAFGIGEKADDPVTMYLSDIYTLAANLAGLPGISIPAGFVEQRPVGLQLMSNYLREDLLLNVAHRFQLATDWHRRVPEGC